MPTWTRSAVAAFLLVIGMAVSGTVWWRYSNRMNTTELLMRLPKPRLPKTVSVTYEAVKMPTLWHLENCSPPVVRGSVDDAGLLQSSGNSDLDQRILEWFRRLHFAAQKGCDISWNGNALVNVEF